MTGLRPTNITADRNTRVLKIDWTDGHVSPYSFSLLRDACPCAECRGGHENMGSLPEAEIYLRPNVESPATRMRGLEAVGSYALSPEWEDGHHYGIYSWDYLRAICPCPECRQRFSV